MSRPHPIITPNLLTTVLLACACDVTADSPSDRAPEGEIDEIVENLREAGYSDEEIEILDDGEVTVGDARPVSLEASRAMVSSYQSVSPTLDGSVTTPAPHDGTPPQQLSADLPTPDGLHGVPPVLPLDPDFDFYEGNYALPSFNIDRGIVRLRGRARNLLGEFYSGQVIGTLPVGFRPSDHLIFNVNHLTETFRVDVRPNGNVTWQTGTQIDPWVSLEGIAFSLNPKAPLPLDPNVVAYGGEFADPTSHLIDDTVVVSGLVEKVSGIFTAGQVIGTLPGDQRPSERLIFNLNQHDETARVDVLPDGRIMWITGTSTFGWVSLDGIEFERTMSNALTLGAGVTPYGNVYRDPSWGIDGNTFRLSGLVTKAGGWSPGDVVGIVPAVYCPYEHHVFNLNQHDHVARVDLTWDCELIWRAGRSSYEWLSLDGIARDQ